MSDNDQNQNKTQDDDIGEQLNELGKTCVKHFEQPGKVMIVASFSRKSKLV